MYPVADVGFFKGGSIIISCKKRVQIFEATPTLAKTTPIFTPFSKKHTAVHVN